VSKRDFDNTSQLPVEISTGFTMVLQEKYFNFYDAVGTCHAEIQLDSSVVKGGRRRFMRTRGRNHSDCSSQNIQRNGKKLKVYTDLTSSTWTLHVGVHNVKHVINRRGEYRPHAGNIYMKVKIQSI
jgi:hypothetical protein